MLLIKSFHIIAMVAWFAGLFYLPRLFAYHAAAQLPEMQKQFEIMERRLFYAIMTPAAGVTILLGIWLAAINWERVSIAYWFWIKVILVAGLVIYHLLCEKYRRELAAGKSQRTSKFYRAFNEIPTLLLIIIVLLVELQPF